MHYELPRAITEWIGGQHKDMGESGGKQVIMGAAAGVSSNVGHAAQGAATRDTINGKGDKEDKPKKGSKNQDSTETAVNPQKAPAVEGESTNEVKADANKVDSRT